MSTSCSSFPLPLPASMRCTAALCRDHKGSGLSLMVELLAGALVGGAVQDKKQSRNWGCLVAAVDPACFGSPEEFAARVRQTIARVKDARREAGAHEILIPGERGYREAGAAIQGPRHNTLVLCSNMAKTFLS